MNYKKFEELPCWNKARELSQAVFKITNQPGFRKDLAYVIRYGGRQGQPWTTSLKALMMDLLVNLSGSWAILRDHAVKCSLNSIGLWIVNILFKKSLTKHMSLLLNAENK